MRRVCHLMLVMLITPLLLSADSFVSYHFTAHLSPSTEVPVVTDRQVVGEAHIGIHVTRDDDGAIVSGYVDFDVSYYLGQEEELRAMHIHRAPAGVAGGVVIGSPFGPSFVDGPGSNRLFRQREVDDDAVKEAIEGILADPSGYYLNIHSVSHGAGLLRGQLRRSDRHVLDWVHELSSDIRDNTIRTLRAMGFFIE